MSDFRSSPEWRFGECGEGIARDWLTRTGYAVVPVSLIENGGAPKLLQWVKETILPDNQVFKGGRPQWVEVKTKTKAAFYAKTGKERTGCNLAHYRAYLEVQRVTGMPCSLMFLHLKEKEIWFAPLDRLSWGLQEVTSPAAVAQYGSPMAMFNREDFDIFRIDGDDLAKLESARPMRPPPTPIQVRKPVAKEATLFEASLGILFVFGLLAFVVWAVMN